ncbi:MAG: glycosyltransferase [Actinomycetota bacterium]
MTPRVRVVVVDYDGGDLTLECLRSLVATDWPADALEIVLVDNASPSPVVDIVSEELPSVRVVRAAANRGFGAGCNLGLRDLDAVDYAALVNNDVVVPAGWLHPLVEAFGTEAAIGATCPKILLHDRYREVVVDAPTSTRRLDRRPRGVCVLGFRAADRDLWARVRFPSGFWGPEYAREQAVVQWTGNGGPATLLVPAVDGPTELLLAADRPTRVTLSTAGGTTAVIATSTPTWHTVPEGGDALDVIHNVGSTIGPDGYGTDRGYLEVDRGQYDDPVDVGAWCGAGVLLSRDYLHDVGIFDEELFLYYEDIELAWRGATRGWRYRTAPESVVRHVHSASTSANALRTSELNERNRLLVLARHGPRAATRRALWRFGLATASYARRDLAAPVARGDAPNPRTVSMRLRALGGFVRRARVFSRTNRSIGPDAK